MLIKKGSKSLYDYCQENPEKLYLLEEWDYDLNYPLDPQNIALGNRIKIFWKCSKCKYKWETTVYHRVMRGHNCPCCSNKVVVKGINDLATTHHDLLNEWDYKENEKIGITPQDVVAGSSVAAFWICKTCGYRYEMSIVKKIKRNFQCPHCRENEKNFKAIKKTVNEKIKQDKNSLFLLHGTSFPEMALYCYVFKIYPDALHRHKIQNIEFDIYIPSLNLAIEYDGYYWHKDKIEADNKKDIFCKNNNIRLIRLRSEKLIQTESAETIWVNEKHNKELEDNIKKALKIININNIEINLEKDWIGIMNNELLNHKENNIKNTYPDLAAQWHPTFNGDLKPENVSYGSEMKVWWLCPICGYEWQAVVFSRASGHGCPSCANNISWSDNEVEILREYYPTEGTKVKMRLLNRTEAAIRNKVRALNIKKL